MKSGAKHIELLDHLRGVAILAVLIFHTLGMAFGYDALPWKGWLRDFSGHATFLYFLPVGMIAQAGVAIFFVVSGFCIHLSFETQGREWRGFFVRRFFRIYPPYLLALLLSFLILAVNPGLDFRSRDFWTQLLTHIFLVHNYNPATVYGINAALWSLAVEAQLYLIYPLLLGLAGRIGWSRALWILAGCEVLIRELNGGLQTMDAQGTSWGQISWWLANSPLGYWFSWAIGARIADAWLKKEPLPFANASPILWLGLALAAHFAKPLYVFQFPLFAVATAAVAARGLSGGVGFKMPAFSLGLLQKIGLWSYSLYLLHQPLLHVYSHLIVWAVPAEYLPAPVSFALVVVTWLAIIPLSALWFEVIEIPSIAIGKKIGKAKTLLTDKAGQPGVTGANAPRKNSSVFARCLLIGLLAAGLVATLFISCQFSVRAAIKRSREAWMLATSPDAARRNGAQAVKLAEDACLQTQYRQPQLIAILSAAYAEAGRFDEAIGAAQTAGKLAWQAGDARLLQRCQELLKAYARHEPFREAAGVGAN